MSDFFVPSITVSAAAIRLMTIKSEKIINKDKAMYLVKPVLRSRRALLNNIHPISEVLQF